MIKVIVTELEYHKALEVFTRCAGFECVPAPAAEAQLAAGVSREGASYVVVGVEKYTGLLYDALPRGGVIARFGVGHDGVDKALAKAKGIFCTNTPGALDASVAECTVGMLLLAARRFVACASDNRNGNWSPRVGVELAGKTLAVIGCGHIGSKVAAIAKNGFGMRVVGFDIVAPGVPAAAFDAFSSEFEVAVQSADFVTVHIPDLESTRNFIDAAKLRQMRPTAWLINTARGNVVAEDDLFDAVSSGTIGGAVLDVFKREPYVPSSGKDLRMLENVVMTPHIGSSTQEACRRMAESALESIRAIATGNMAGAKLIPMA
jgi:phosphoglycerate dehydrogenase-like enzyme